MEENRSFQEGNGYGEATLATVQWEREADSHGRGLLSRLGTPEGIFPGTAYDRAVHMSTIRGTP